MKKHRLSERAPLVSMILAAVFATVLIGLASMITKSEVLGFIIISVAGIIFLVIQQWWFSPEYKGSFIPEIPFSTLVVLFIPLIVQCVVEGVAGIVEHGWYFKSSVMAVAMSLSAGFGEETMFRGSMIPIGMRYFKMKNKHLFIAVFTSLVFGLSHIGNIFTGASVVMGLIQGFATIFSGLFLGAVFIRSGSILPSIIIHVFYDWFCFVTDPSLDSGIMTSESVSLTVIISIGVSVLLGLIGLYLLRPGASEEIEAVWKKKWSTDDQ